ncbi:hypothetical protein B0H67DRAFT_583038 [Lasiosphaeris hirsuta]|uniref:Uncharacterized protein n=1 Tax=Lasiosphaeris hirsuta TaxID=260670 RepID=A0AA40A7D6_9PEZI|nr:hypothetical protein B0H67DRAFT_583038 [Lasiosphaeris hirsuta]
MANESRGSIAFQSLPAEGEESATAFSERVLPAPTLGAAPLCDRCSTFDIQSFTRTPHRSRGYKRSDTERSVASNCRFCLLLLDSVQGLDPSDPFYILTFGELKSTKPELYIHMTLSENYETATQKTAGPFCFNRLQIAIGGRFDEVRSHSEVELCVAADTNSPAANEKFISGRYLGPDPDDEAHWETIRRWLDECASPKNLSPSDEATNGHKKCRETASGLEILDHGNPVMPIRCIKVDPTGKLIVLEDTETKTELYIP